MSKLDRSRDYGVVTNHSTIAYVQDGKHFDSTGHEIGAEREPEVDTIIQTDNVAKGEAFLLQILQNGQLPKSSIYKEANETLMNWEDVKKAFLSVGCIKLMVNKQEYWKLPESTQ